MITNLTRRANSALLTTALLLACAPSANAYYDDVHYGLTYVVARMVGYTPEQAYRIASACVSIDYSQRTEPVQAYGAVTGSLAMTIDEPPRWKFHAFRNEQKFPQSVGNSPSAAAADKEILRQRIELYNLGFEERNPGAYLHFYQDEVPHRSYTSNGGHWFRQTLLSSPITTALTIAASSLPMGGTPDWLSYRFAHSSSDPAVSAGQQPDSNTALAFNTHRTLSAIMTRLSNGTIKPRPFPAAGSAEHQHLVAGLLAKLREVNPHPDTLLLNEVWSTAVIKVLDGAEKMDWDKYDPATREKMLKHCRGPDMDKARTVINAALAAAGFPDQLPKDRKIYEFNNEGKFTGSRDQFQVIGALRVLPDPKLFRAAHGGTREVLVKLPAHRKGDAETVIRRVILDVATRSITLKNVPVGTLAIELRTSGRLLARSNVEIDGAIVEARLDPVRPELASLTH